MGDSQRPSWRGAAGPPKAQPTPSGKHPRDGCAERTSQRGWNSPIFVLCHPVNLTQAHGPEFSAHFSVTVPGNGQTANLTEHLVLPTQPCRGQGRVARAQGGGLAQGPQAPRAWRSLGQQGSVMAPPRRLAAKPWCWPGPCPMPLADDEHGLPPPGTPLCPEQLPQLQLPSAEAALLGGTR